MKICIVGAGPAGAYLARRLSGPFEVEVFDRHEPDRWGRDCACIIQSAAFRDHCRRVGLDAGDYVIYVADRLISAMHANNGAAIIDKNAFLRDLMEKSGAPAHHLRVRDLSDLPPCDLAVDATGWRRALLPASERRRRWLLPCYQVEIESDRLPAHICTRRQSVGYLWVTPLSGDFTSARVGCGSFDVSPRRAVNEYLEQLGPDHYRPVPGSGRAAAIRCLTPSLSRPFCVDGEPPVVGCGESMGAVSPVTGEGIGSALVCAELLARALERECRRQNLRHVATQYERAVRRELSWTEGQFRFVRAVRFSGRARQFASLVTVREPQYAALRFQRLNAAVRALRGTRA